MRLWAGDNEYITMQKSSWKKTPLKYINYRKFVKYMETNGYRLLYSGACAEAIPEANLYNIPKEFSPLFKINVVFVRVN